MPQVNHKIFKSAGRKLALVMDSDGLPSPVAVVTRPSSSSPSRHRAILVTQVPEGTAVISDMRMELN